MKNCLKCEYHQVISDPDPHDWYCQDDVAVICIKNLNSKSDKNSIYASDRTPFKVISCALRPYEVKEGSIIKTPDWCPLKIEEIDADKEIIIL